MTVRRVMGIETEYGIAEPGHPMANPMLLSSYVVAAYAGTQLHRAARARWDYDDEDPLQDARGFHLDRASAHPSVLTDDPAHPAPSGDATPEDVPARRRPGAPQSRPRLPVEEYEDPGVANVILTNGARLYVDHAHPEYSSPEVTSPRDLVVWDKAGEQVMLRAARIVAVNPALPDVTLYKNNVDGKGATYGTHENYLVDRAVPFAEIVDVLTPFFVTRTVFTGAGRVGIGQVGQLAGFQLAQRADYIEAEVGLETTLRRPIINTRDEPHADPERWRRLHVIIGDANMLEVATFLKVGTSSLVLWLLEHRDAAPHAVAAVRSLRLVEPVGAVQLVSRDLTMTTRLALADGRRLTALEIQRCYLEAVRGGLEEAATPPDAATAEVLDRWESVLTRLATDPASCAREVEWLAKLRLLEGLRRRDHLSWDHPRLAAVDIQWSDLRPERGLYHRLLEAGAVERLVDADAVSRAVHEPPTDTRAYFRGRALARFGAEISAASWDSLIFDVPGAATLQRVGMRDPWRGTEAHVRELLDSSGAASELLEKLMGPRGSTGAA